MINEFSHVFAFIILGLIFVAGGLVTNRLLRPNRPNEFKLSAYECGEDPVGNSWLKFNNRFYVVALIFILAAIGAVVNGARTSTAGTGPRTLGPGTPNLGR